MIRYLALGAVLLAGAAAADVTHPLRAVQTFLHERVIVRVRTQNAAPAKIKYKEKKGPRCMATDEIAAAAVHDEESVDFALKGGTRLRAELGSDCPPLDYYGGFYLAPTADRRVCADRDSIHARSGGECAIERFRTLVPVK